MEMMWKIRSSVLVDIFLCNTAKKHAFVCLNFAFIVRNLVCLLCRSINQGPSEGH